MPRVRHRDFSKGLWTAGPRDTIPAGTMRQAKGVRPLLTTSVKSRWGSRLITSLANVHSLFRFNDRRFFGAGTDFLGGSGVVGSAANPTSAISPFALRTSGNVLRFAKGIPCTEIDREQFPAGPEFLYVVGGGLTPAGLADNPGAFNTAGVFKISTNNAASPMGIPAPLVPPLVNHEPAIEIPIESFNMGDFITDQELNPVAVGISNTLRQEAAASTHVTMAASSIGAISKNFSPRKNLVSVGAFAKSSEQDWIQLWILVDKPWALTNIELLFDSTPGDPPSGLATASKGGLIDTFAFQILVEDSVLTSEEVFGVGDLVDPSPLTAKEQRQKFQRDAKLKRDLLRRVVPLNAATVTRNDQGTIRLAKSANTWSLIRIPKKSFTRSGQANWAALRRMRISFVTNVNDAVQIFFDGMVCAVGTGMVGDYKYAYTYKNSRTGTRSNPSPTIDEFGNDACVLKGVQRNGGSITNVQLPVLLKHSSQVDTIEMWRTLGNGSVYFKIDEYATTGRPGQLTYTDIVADSPVLQDRVPSAFEMGRLTKYIEAIELPFDNARFPDSCRDVCGPHFNRLFLIGGEPGDRGKLFYSPIGRLEVSEGFIEVSTDDEPLQRCISWSDAIYCISDAWFYEVRGSDVFVASKIFGAPGTSKPSTVVPTPYGIIYQAQDGVRIFDGAGSRLLFPEAILPLFRGETSVEAGQTDGVAAFVGTYACYKDDEYVITDGSTTTLGCNLRTGAWRNIGVSASSLFVEPETNQLLMARGSSGVFEWEVPNVLVDGSTAIPFVVETPGTLVEDQTETTKIVQRLYLDINAGTAVTVKLRYTAPGGVTTIAVFSTASRQLLEYSLGQPGDVISVEISGNIIQPVELFGVEFDVHLPEQPGALT